MMINLLFIFATSLAMKVNITFTGEAMCPDTTKAFGLGLNATVMALGLGEDSIINLEIIPWGNSYYNNSVCGVASYNKSWSMFCWVEMCNVEYPPADCWDGHVMCQHNDNECFMMMYQECALEVGGIEEGYQFYGCLTNKESMAWRNGKSGRVLLEAAAHQCTRNQNIHTCFQTNSELPADRNIWNRYARQTLELGIARKGTPWILVNGEVVDYTDLLESVCAAYDGELPPGCKQSRRRIVSQWLIPAKVRTRRWPGKYSTTLLEITYYEHDFCQGAEILVYYVDIGNNCNQGFYLDRAGVEFVYNSSSKTLSYNEYTANTCSTESLVVSTPLEFESCSLAGFNWNTYRMVEGPVVVNESNFILDIGYENPTCDLSGWYGFSIIPRKGTCLAFCDDYDNVKFSQKQRCSPFTFPAEGKF